MLKLLLLEFKNNILFVLIIIYNFNNYLIYNDKENHEKNCYLLFLKRISNWTMTHEQLLKYNTYIVTFA